MKAVASRSSDADQQRARAEVARAGEVERDATFALDGESARLSALAHRSAQARSTAHYQGLLNRGPSVTALQRMQRAANESAQQPDARALATPPRPASGPVLQAVWAVDPHRDGWFQDADLQLRYDSNTDRFFAWNGLDRRILRRGQNPREQYMQEIRALMPQQGAPVNANDADVAVDEADVDVQPAPNVNGQQQALVAVQPDVVVDAQDQAQDGANQQAAPRPRAADLTAQLGAGISASAPGRAAHVGLINLILDGLRGNQIPYKIGGSAAAMLLGARRSPHDMELEMSNFQGVRDGHGVVQNICQTYHIPLAYQPLGDPVFGVQLRLNGTIHNNATGQEDQVRFEIDMMDENAAAMNQQLETPADMDQALGEDSQEIGQVERRSRLIANYADRCVNKSDVARDKQDYHQIHDLLPNPTRDATLAEAVLHGKNTINFDMAGIIRGQNQVSLNVTTAEQAGWMQNGRVEYAAVNGVDETNARQAGWIDGSHLVNVRFAKNAW
jgi:hypothetical protein